MQTHLPFMTPRVQKKYKSRFVYANSHEAIRADLESKTNRIARLEADQRIKIRGKTWDNKQKVQTPRLDTSLFSKAMGLVS
jgi:hypothetical protein